MSAGLTIPVLIVLILAVALLIGIRRQRDFKGTERGSEPGEGYHELESNYSSGLGGHQTTWRVPRDPQEYARHFVPAAKKSKDTRQQD